MSPRDRQRRPGVSTEYTSSRPLQEGGVWLNEPTADALCRLDLRPPSLWRVLFALLITLPRSGAREVHIKTEDLSRMTGLSARTVKTAVAKLVDLKLVTRIGRYERYWVNVPAPGACGCVDAPVPPARDDGWRRRTSGRERPGDRLACTAEVQASLPLASTISISCLSYLEKESKANPFTGRQVEVIKDVLVEATELLGEDVSKLTMLDTCALLLGLTSPVTYGGALEQIVAANDRDKARKFVRAVLARRKDERVQGRELILFPPGR